jgi:imidazolonepropionase
MDSSVGAGLLGRVDDAAVVFEGDRVVWVGPTDACPPVDRIEQASGAIGMPGLVDCHTHAVWAGSRAHEFRERLSGVPYTDILEAGGGIRSTVAHTRAASAEVLTELATARLAGMRRRGVTTVEIKSGYGLTVEAERRILVAAREAGRRAGVRVRTTFLGAHCVPTESLSDPDAYVCSVIEQQLPAVADVADMADVYVDRGAFTLEQGRAILTAAAAHGLGLRIHAEQVTYTGAAAMAAGLGAWSADHLERLDEAGVAALARAGTVAGLLPGAMLYLRDPPPPVAMLRAAGVPMAVATDFNPGSSPVDDLWTCATLACVTMGLTVEEALLGITAVAARAVGCPDRGRIAPGCVADLALFDPPPGEPADATSLVQHLTGVEATRVIVGGV